MGPKNNKESSADELKLQMVGQTKTTVIYYTGSGDNRQRRTAKETKDSFSYDVQLASFGGKAASGVHNFPFSMTLPVGLPPSMKETSGRSSCSMRYSFNAHLHRLGLLTFDAKHSSVLTVLGTPQQAGPAVPVMAGPVTQPVKYLWCFSRGSMTMGFHMERSVAGFNDPKGLAVAARNNSSSSVNKLTIQLKQECIWSADRHQAKKDQTLASTLVLPGSELEGLQWVPGAGNDRGQSVTQIDLQQQLAAGAGTRFQLVVPGNSLPSLQAENVTITHSVGVVLDTPCCIAEPCLWARLCVVPTVSAPEAQPGAMSLVPPQALLNLPPQTVQNSAGPYGSARTAQYPNNSPTYGSDPIQQALTYTSAVQMDAYGNDKPEYVPQTAG